MQEAFARFGAVRRHVRRSWSAVSDDGGTVVLALWSDRFRWKDRPLTYDGSERPGLRDGAAQRVGNQERLEHLIYARDRCGGQFRVVMVKAKNPDAPTRAVYEVFPRDDWLMQITELDESTGEFQAVRVEG